MEWSATRALLLLLKKKSVCEKFSDPPLLELRPFMNPQMEKYSDSDSERTKIQIHALRQSSARARVCLDRVESQANARERTNERTNERTKEGTRGRSISRSIRSLTPRQTYRDRGRRRTTDDERRVSFRCDNQDTKIQTTHCLDI